MIVGLSFEQKIDFFLHFLIQQFFKNLLQKVPNKKFLYENIYKYI